MAGGLKSTFTSLLEDLWIGLTFLIFLVPAIPALAHSGGLDAYGCHHNRTLGGYHCHRGAFAGLEFPSKAAMLRSLEEITSPRPKTETQSSLMAQVVRVVDGDTIWICCIAGKSEKVRYIGINTPETKHPKKGVEYFGKEASEANRKLVDGKTVSLEFDVEQRDRYRRLLAYVFLKDGTFVNAWLVENGFAQVMTVPPNVKHEGLFRKFQREAREFKRGLWGR